MLFEVFRGGSGIHSDLQAVQTCPVFAQVIPARWRSPAQVNVSNSTTTELHNQTEHPGKFCHQKEDSSLEFSFSYSWKVAELQRSESKHHA